MLTYSFENRGNDTLYEHLYKQIKNDIKSHKLKPDEKLPSKRALAKHLDISTITIENAYSQLMAEGYIYSIPRSGFYVSEIPLAYFEKSQFNDLSLDDIKPDQLLFNKSNKDEKVGRRDKPENPKKLKKDKEMQNYFIDFLSNSIATDNFPFSNWSKLMRETISNNKEELMKKSPSIGVYKLRCAIVNYLYEFRAMNVEPEQIVIGAGTEYLYGLILQLLGHDKIYAIEDPGYQKISHIYQANNVECVHIPMDEEGIHIGSLEGSNADVLHITPSHHFPTGIVTPISRRYELLSWAAKSQDRFIIEDDYDSEFRLVGKPIPALQSIDESEKVIYINTFSKSLTSTIRISYMILPKALMARYNNELNFYACTVSNFEQYTLARFIEDGYFEKHINRMRTYYKNIRDTILTNIKNQGNDKKIRIKEEDAGLHFLLELDTDLSDKELMDLAKNEGINLSCLSQYYYDKSNAIEHNLVINYSGIDIDKIEEGVERLFKVLK